MARDRDGVLGALVAQAGYRPGEPVLVGLQRGPERPVFVTAGTAAEGQRLTSVTRVYTASLSKQFTAACVALLATAGELDVTAPLARWLPDLPSWAGTVRLRHLVHHTAGLPADGDIDAALTGHRDRTTAGVLAALTRFPSLHRQPGTAFVYSNAGYVCLAAAVEGATGRPMSGVARERLFGPLGMADTCFWPGPQPRPPRSASLAAGHPAPLSLGDGGVWSTGEDLLRWNQAMNSDVLGIAAVLERPGHLDDGTPLDYAWGIGVRTHAGHRVYRHGGGWPGVRLLLARVPDQDAGIVIIALADDTDRHVALADSVLEVVTPASGTQSITRRPGSRSDAP
jgi:CubicO group peptidase (beta-lactamase class C family)